MLNSSTPELEKYMMEKVLIECVFGNIIYGELIMRGHLKSGSDIVKESVVYKVLFRFNKIYKI